LPYAGKKCVVAFLIKHALYFPYRLLATLQRYTLSGQQTKKRYPFTSKDTAPTANVNALPRHRQRHNQAAGISKEQTLNHFFLRSLPGGGGFRRLSRPRRVAHYSTRL